LWNDSTALYGYTGTFTSSVYPYEFNSLISAGTAVNPTYSPWNASGSSAIITDFTGQYAITSTDAYTVDSLLIPGWYTRSSIATTAKAAVVDTLIVSMVYGNGASTSDLSAGTLTGSVVTTYCPTCTGSMSYYDLWHDITNNRAAHNGGTTNTVVYKFLLTASDTNADAYKSPQFPRAGHSDPVISFAVPAGNSVAASVTYKSGDATYHTDCGTCGGNPGDTIRTSNGTAIGVTKFDYWEAQVFYAATSSTSTTPLWNWYDPGNLATSSFENVANGWGTAINKYYENWDIITGTPSVPQPASQQNLHIAFHTECMTCLVLGPSSGALGTKNVIDPTSISVFPNPASDQLTVAYSGALSTDMSVSLVNMVGQVVSTQKTNNGKVVFNTTNLPDGIYIYTLEANNSRSTGRVVVAH
jgi:hypothetical protein